VPATEACEIDLHGDTADSAALNATAAATRDQNSEHPVTHSSGDDRRLSQNQATSVADQDPSVLATTAAADHLELEELQVFHSSAFSGLRMNREQATAARELSGRSESEGPRELSAARVRQPDLLQANQLPPDPVVNPWQGSAGHEFESKPGDISGQIVQELLLHAESASESGRTDFYMRLDPPELGTVRVYLTATDHSLSARLVVSEDATRQLIENQLDSLRAALSQAGISLGQFDVAQQGARSREQWRDRQNSAPPRIAPAGWASHAGAPQPIWYYPRSPRPGRIDVLA
jgi:flagellar hook-length control protein FliK